MKPQRVRTKASIGDIEISGWLSDKKGTYLWFGYKDRCLGVLDGQRLYRLAKAIVNRFEAPPQG